MSSKTDRRAREILNLLLQEGKISVEDLTARFGASAPSIRRDLSRLESQGLVHRTHGGAVATDKITYEPFRFDDTFDQREDRFIAEKQRIAHAAAALVQEHETVGLSAGTTTMLLAKLLSHRAAHVITNGINIGMELSSSTTLQTTLTGGSLRWPGAFSLVGPMAAETLNSFVLDQLFLSVTGIDPKRGATLFEPEEAAIFRAMVHRARRVIVVADSSKAGHVSPAVICPPASVNMLITDDGISADLRRGFEAMGVKVVIV